MASPPRFQLFTYDATPTPAAHSFTLFPTLPAELRIQIWRLALERPRIILVTLFTPQVIDDILAKQGDTRPETRGAELYSVIAGGYQTISKLFRVSRESRDVALEFYRLRLPCWLTRSARRYDAIKPGTLYLNPEHDFFFIKNQSNNITGFFHDLKTVHDPRGVGLLNLAINTHSLCGWGCFCAIKPFELSSPFRESYIETLAQLREVFFVQGQSTGHYEFGIGYEGTEDGSEDETGAPSVENRPNPSLPIIAQALNFDRLPLDPRPIDQDLSRIFVGIDPRYMLYLWRRYLYDHFGDCVMPQTEYKILLAFEPDDYEVYDRQDADRWLRQEKDNWLKKTSRSGEPDEAPVENLGEAVEPAFGFWLFSADAFGPLPENPRDAFEPRGPHVLDLREHWPELALLNLP